MPGNTPGPAASRPGASLRSISESFTLPVYYADYFIYAFLTVFRRMYLYSHKTDFGFYLGLVYEPFTDVNDQEDIKNILKNVTVIEISRFLRGEH